MDTCNICGMSIEDQEPRYMVIRYGNRAYLECYDTIRGVYHECCFQDVLNMLLKQSSEDNKRQETEAGITCL